MKQWYHDFITSLDSKESSLPLSAFADQFSVRFDYKTDSYLSIL